jgi:hypothetical protein
MNQADRGSKKEKHESEGKNKNRTNVNSEWFPERHFPNFIRDSRVIIQETKFWGLQDCLDFNELSSTPMVDLI